MALWPLLAVLTSSLALAGWEDAAPFTAPGPALLEAVAEAPEDARLPGIRVLLEEHGYAYDEAGLETEVVYRVYGITQASMVDSWGVTEAGWAPWHQQRPEVRVRIVGASGQEYLLTDAEMNEVTPTLDDPTMFSDARMLRAPLPGVGVGAVVEERIVVREHQPFVAGGASHQVPLMPYRPTGRYRVWVEAPPSLPLRWEVREGEVHVAKRRRKGVRGIEVEVTEGALGAPLDFLPSDRTGFPHLVFSTASSWSDIALTYHQRVASVLDPSGLDALVARLEEEAPTPREQIDRAYRIARDELRYTGVEFGVQAVVPYRPADSLARGYGDCKDKATLLVTLLAQVGIDGRLALLRAGSHLDIAPDFPGANGFDHVIVYVPEHDLWLDPTATLSPPGRLPPEDAGRWALVVSPGGGKLVRTPAVTASDHFWREVRHVRVQPDGYAQVREEVEADGWPARGLRLDLAEQSPAELAENLAGYGLETYHTDQVSDVVLAHAEDVTQPVQLTSSYAQSGIGGGGTEEAAVWVNPSVLAAFVPSLVLDGEGLAERSEPVVFTPFVSEVVYDVELPPLYVPRDLPEPASHTLGSVTLSVEVETQEGGARVRWRLDGGDGVLTVAQARQLQELLLPLAEEVPLTWDQQGALWLSEGRVREALALYDARIAAEPEELLYATWRTEALLAVRMGPEARRYAAEVVQAHSEAPETWLSLGFARLHDDFGRPMRGPLDYAGALDAYATALELSPEHPLALRNLAVLYEHDSDGVKYGEGADLSAAVGFMERYRADGEHTELDVNLLTAQLLLGRPEQVRTLAAEMEATVDVVALDMAAVALVSGVGAVHRTLRGFAVDRGTRVSVLEAASQALAMARHYPLAAEVLRLAEADADNPLQVRQQAERLAGARDWRVVVGEAEPEVQAALQLVAARLRGAGVPDALVTSELRDGDARWDQAPVARVVGVPPVTLADRVLGTATWVVSGPARGPRLVVLNDGLGGVQRLVVAREGRTWRVRAMGHHLDHMAWEAFRALRKGDEATGRWWWRWLMEAQGSTPEQAEAATDAHDTAALRLLSAAAMSSLQPALALAELERVDTPVLTDSQLRSVRLAALALLGRDEERVALATAALQTNSQDPAAWAHRIEGLHQLGRTAEAIEVLAGMQDAGVGDHIAWAKLSALLGEQLTARAHWAEAQADGMLSPAAANDYAWSLLFAPAEPELAVTLAERSLAARKTPSPEALHTLAAAHARAGQVQPALNLLGTALRLSDGPLDGVWGLVLGDLATSFGLPEAAAEAYARVPEEDGALATRRLVEQR